MGLFHWGRPDSRGRAVVLLHGAGGDHRLWAPVWQRLRTRDIPALALDLPGHGRSPGPARASVAEYALETERQLQRAGVTDCILAGHSLGGAIALSLAARGPTGLRGLAAVATGARLPVDPRIVEGTIKAFACTVEKLARFCYAKGTPPDVWRRAAETMAAAGPETLHRDFSACAAYALPADELTSIAVPTEVVCGELDVLTPVALSEDLAARIPSARLTRIPGCGHMPLLEAPDAVAGALLRLWERTFSAAVA